MNRLLQHIRILAITSMATALLTGCPVQTKRVLVVGDSISYMAAGELSNVGSSVVDEDPANRMNFTVLANIGIGARNTLGEPSDPDEYWQGFLSNSIRPGSFDAVVVALATNDCGALAAPGDYAQDIERIAGAIAAVDPDVPIFWLTLPDYAHAPDCAGIVNGDLGAIIEAANYPNLHSFDYNAWSAENPHCFSDGIHHRDGWRQDPASGGANLPAPPGYCYGQRQYAKWIKAQLDAFFGPRW